MHNTDPFIFGPHILYSNCGQTARSKRALKHLGRGSVIAFGSGRGIKGDRTWVLDTVLVVKDSFPYDPLNPREALEGKVPEPFLEVTGGPLADNPEKEQGSGSCAPSETELRLYRGATPKDRVHGMFSFFPARPAGGDTGFSRPVVGDLPKERFNPDNWQAPKGATCELELDELRRLWEQLVERVREEGLVLGTRANLPPQRG